MEIILISILLVAMEVDGGGGTLGSKGLLEDPLGVFHDVVAGAATEMKDQGEVHVSCDPDLTLKGLK